MNYSRDSKSKGSREPLMAAEKARGIYKQKVIKSFFVSCSRVVAPLIFVIYEAGVVRE